MADVVKPGDAQFFERTGPHSLASLAALVGAAVDQPDRLISGVAPLQTAGPDDVSFLDNKRYADLLPGTKAGAVILHPDFAARVPAGTVALATPEPYVGWAKVAALFHPAPAVKAGIHPRAVVDPTARVDAGASIGDGVSIGQHCRIGAQVTVSHAIIGNRVVLFPGVRIGQDGFGFAMGKE